MGWERTLARIEPPHAYRADAGGVACWRSFPAKRCASARQASGVDPSVKDVHTGLYERVGDPRVGCS